MMSELNLDNFKVDKTDWQLVKFGEVVFEPKENCKHLISEGIEHVVGLEHIDSEDIHLRRSASIEEATTFTKKFAEADVLFGRRRAYLKKAAKAEFAGVCSGDIIVMRANQERLMPDLLPFIVNNEKFFDYAITHSAGGLSPRVKFKDLANYEFLLPPKEQQAELAELLWNLEDLIELKLKTKLNFNAYYLTALKRIFDTNTKKLPLIDVCKEKPRYGANSPATEYDGLVRYLRITDIGEMGTLNQKKVSAQVHHDKYLLSYGDFLIARSADPGRAYFYQEKDGLSTYAGYLIKFKLDLEKMLPEYLYFFSQTFEYQQWINQTTRKGTLSNINSKEFSSMKVPVADISVQKAAIKKVNNIYELFKLVNKNIEDTTNMRSSIINKVF